MNKLMTVNVEPTSLISHQIHKILITEIVRLEYRTVESMKHNTELFALVILGLLANKGLLCDNMLTVSHSRFKGGYECWLFKFNHNDTEYTIGISFPDAPKPAES